MTERFDEAPDGDLDKAPPGAAGFTRRLAVGLVVLAAGVGLGLALLLEPFDEGVFEYGLIRDYEGKLLVDPHPRLLAADGPAEGYLLVGRGKHGLELDEAPGELWPSPPSREIELSGTLIQNEEAAMLEVHSLTLPNRQAAGDEGEERTAERRVVAHADRIVGEIVDTKCYLGAMKPGRGKPHRECASLCIRGGIPAALLVRTKNGERRLVHLASFGRPVGKEALEFVGQPVEATGLLTADKRRLLLDTYVLRAVHSSMRPLELLREARATGPENNR